VPQADRYWRLGTISRAVVNITRRGCKSIVGVDNIQTKYRSELPLQGRSNAGGSTFWNKAGGQKKKVFVALSQSHDISNSDSCPEGGLGAILALIHLRSVPREAREVMKRHQWVKSMFEHCVFPMIVLLLSVNISFCQNTVDPNAPVPAANQPFKRITLKVGVNGQGMQPLQPETWKIQLTSSHIDSHYGERVLLPYMAATRFEWNKEVVPSHIKILRYNDKKLESCRQVVPQDGSITILPSSIRCADGGPVDHGGLVEVAFDLVTYRADIQNRNLPVFGSDLGIGLSVTDRLHDEEGFRLDSATSGYFSLSKLKTQRWRTIASLAVLDFDPDIDFELGVGFGLLFRTGISSTAQSPNGFSVAMGYGYNLMTHESSEAIYGFLGFGWNFNREVSFQERADATP
jgi:hypothetical protein